MSSLGGARSTGVLGAKFLGSATWVEVVVESVGMGSDCDIVGQNGLWEGRRRVRYQFLILNRSGRYYHDRSEKYGVIGCVNNSTE